MKIKDLRPYLDAQWLVITSSEHPEEVEYIAKSELNAPYDDIEVAAISPLPAIKKSVFTTDAEEGDYTAALRIVFGSRPPEQAYTDHSASAEESAAKSDAASETHQTSEEDAKSDTQSQQNTGNPYANFGAFGMPDAQTIAAMMNSMTPADMAALAERYGLTEDKIASLMGSMDPSAVAQMAKGLGLDSMFGGMDMEAALRMAQQMFSQGTPQSPTDTNTSDETDEYEEID